MRKLSSFFLSAPLRKLALIVCSAAVGLAVTNGTLTLAPWLSIFGLVPGSLTFVAMSFLGTKRWRGTDAHAQGPFHATIGTDGIRFRGLLRTRFIPFSEIRSISRSPGGVILHLANGHTKRVKLSKSESFRFQWVASQILKLHQDSSSIRTASTSRAAEEAVATWVMRLRSLVLEGRYRDRPVQPEEIVEIIENPKANADERIAAASLAATFTPELQLRVRVAIDDILDPALAHELEASATAGQAFERGRR